MDLAEFVNEKRHRWESLERLLQVTETQGVRVLSVEQGKEFIRLYRLASSDLVWSQAHAGLSEVVDYLNRLVARAYAQVAPRPKLHVRALFLFVLEGFPRLLVGEWRVFVLAVGLFFGGAGFGYLAAHANPELAHHMVSEDHILEDPAQRVQREATGETLAGDKQVLFASFLFTHNIQVAIFCFCLGLTLGIGTALLLFFNGVLLGSLAWVYAQKGLLAWFCAWILPHGIPEITVICIAGAAGFLLARGIVSPKDKKRSTALYEASKPATQLLLGTFPLFVYAGIIEATLSQIHPPKLSIAFKLGFALFSGLLVYGYLLSPLLQRVWWGLRGGGTPSGRSLFN
ncbi:MAG: stage II sporulation protein M [Proteobacteria bacterium]|nr:stage II sporulation protein M [Cystobacterineae bacterium]MCL2259618.1 stage II sporulation protein M [Cystobacterineae bacterium]MCL2313862.1 stage II sporulation protein M [Pseudomonadota bacterium]